MHLTERTVGDIDELRQRTARERDALRRDRFRAVLMALDGEEALAIARARMGPFVVGHEARPDLSRVLAEADLDLIFNIADGVEGRPPERLVEHVERGAQGRRVLVHGRRGGGVGGPGPARRAPPAEKRATPEATHPPAAWSGGVDLAKARRLQVDGYNARLAGDYGKSLDFMVHRVAAAGNVPGLENLPNLDQLPPAGATVIAATPIGFRGEPPGMTSGILGLSRLTSLGGDHAG